MCSNCESVRPADRLQKNVWFLSLVEVSADVSFVLISEGREECRG